MFLTVVNEEGNRELVPEGRWAEMTATKATLNVVASPTFAPQSPTDDTSYNGYATG